MLVDSLRSWRITKTVVSPLKRAQDTISPYLMATGRQAEIWPEIAEACWQDEREEPSHGWRSEPAAVSAAIPHLFAYRNGMAVRPAHPESFGEGLSRVHATADRLKDMARESNDFVLMVTHGHFIREIVNRMLHIHMPARFPHDNCGMTLMSFDGAWTMEFCNRAIPT